MIKKAAIPLLSFILAVVLVSAEALADATSSPGGYVTGQVTSGPSTPLRSVWVLVYDGSSLKGQSLTGDDGRYYVGGLDAKTYKLVVRRQTSGADLVSQSVSLPEDHIRNINVNINEP